MLDNSVSQICISEQRSGWFIKRLRRDLTEVAVKVYSKIIESLRLEETTKSSHQSITTTQNGIKHRAVQFGEQISPFSTPSMPSVIL